MEECKTARLNFMTFKNASSRTWFISRRYTFVIFGSILLWNGPPPIICADADLQDLCSHWSVSRSFLLFFCIHSELPSLGEQRSFIVTMTRSQQIVLLHFISSKFCKRLCSWLCLWIYTDDKFINSSGVKYKFCFCSKINGRVIPLYSLFFSAAEDKRRRRSGR